MLSYKQAIKEILKHAVPPRAIQISLEKALGHVLAKDVFALQPLPNFDNSAVDGYAVCLPSKSGNRKIKLKVQGEIRAGESFKESILPGQAIRIFTGAPIPAGTQAVVMQEDTERFNGNVFLLKSPGQNENIRFLGEDISKGVLLLRKRTELTPARLALLAAVGYKTIPVYPMPKVAILATGSELVKGGEKIKIGKIHDSNSILLKTMVQELRAIPISSPPVGDNPKEIRSMIRKGLKSDLLIISGGVSVGAYDYVKDILREEGVREIFWKVNIKPGKPLFFGKKNRTLVFGLPGNPVSVFVTFEEFVKPALFERMGKNHKRQEKKVKAHLTKPFQNGSRLHFVRVRCAKDKKGYAMTPVKGQGSHMIGSLAASNGILKVEPNRLFRKNERAFVKII